jgi:DNA gyrase/topoisomerase IV subunit B
VEQRIEVLEGVEVVRKRPAMFVGAPDAENPLAARVLQFVVSALVDDEPKPEEVRVTRWREGLITVAYDGAPIPIEPRPLRSCTHPILYHYFMQLVAGGRTERRSLWFGAVLNALSDRLVVWTMHGETPYRAVFRQGGLFSLLAASHVRRALGSTWLTYRTDDTVAPGVVGAGTLAALDNEVGAQAHGVRLTVYVRPDDLPDDDAW